jgi:hypothetical protein
MYPQTHVEILMTHLSLRNHLNDSLVNLKGGVQLAAKTGDDEQMCWMVPGLGSVSGCPRTTPW